MTSLWPLIIASIFALFIGAVFAKVMHTRGWGIAALKGLMASFFGCLLLVHLIPEAYQRLGGISFVFVALGFFAMIMLERLLPGDHHDGGESNRFFTAEMVWVGLLIHQLTDGIGLALATENMANDAPMAWMVIAHRVPVAAIVMWLFVRRGDHRGAWLRLGAMGLATMVGALGAASLGDVLDSGVINASYAFISGSFIHLLIHDFIDFHAHRPSDRHWEFGAFFVGIAIFFWSQGAWADSVGHAELHDSAAGSGHFADAFLVLLQATAPYLLLGLLISGILHQFMPQRPIQWLNRGRPLTQSIKGMLFGLPLPICSCGVLPLFLGLSKKGLPTAALLAFLIATPELGIDSFLISAKLLGWQFTIVRLIAAVFLPVAIALSAVAWIGKPQVIEETKACCESDPKQEGAVDPPVWWRFAFVDLVDDIFPLIMFGLIVAALAQVLWPVDLMQNQFGNWDILLLGLLGIPFYVCASASVPIALILLQHGFSVGAVLVFLFAGPATNISTVLTVNKVFGPGKGLRFGALALGWSVAVGLVVNAVYDPATLDIMEFHEHSWVWWDWVAVIAITLLALASMWRSGPLHWISSLAGMVPGLVHHPPQEGQSNAH